MAFLRVCEGRKTKEGSLIEFEALLFIWLERILIVEVLREQVNAYRNVFIDATENVRKLDEALSKYYGEATVVDTGI